MTFPTYGTISIFSYSPVRGTRCACGISNEALQDLDSRGSMFIADTEQLARLTKQKDPALRMQFALGAHDRAPSQEMRSRIPLANFILHFARETQAWESLKPAPALNLILIDWPEGGGYQIRAYMVGAAGPLHDRDLPFFYEQRRNEAQSSMQASMPLPDFSLTDSS